MARPTRISAPARNLLCRRSSRRSLLRSCDYLDEIKRARTPDDPQPFIAQPSPLGVFELRLDIPRIALALAREYPASIGPGVDDARAGQLRLAILADLALQQKVARLSGRPALTAQVAVLDDAVDIPGESLRIRSEERRTGKKSCY